MKSLKWRLNLGLLISLIGVMLLFGVLGNRTIRDLTEEFVASRLAHDAESLLAGLTLEARRPTLAPERINALYERAYSGHYFRVLGPGGDLRSRSLWDHDLPVAPLASGESRRQRVDGPDGQHLLLLFAGYQVNGEPVTVGVAEDVSVIDQSLEQFNIGFGVLIIAALAGLAAVQSAIVHGSFRSLSRVRESIGRLESGEIEALPESVPLEVQPLVREVNRLLGLMRKRVNRSRNALGNLAHALKGPLNLLVRSAERTGGEDLRQPVETIRGLVDHELRRARIAGAVAPGRRFRPEDEMPAMITLLERVHEERALEIASRVGPGLDLPYDRDDMLELSGNLLDNACKWARGRVQAIWEGGESVRLVVEDDGPGCDAEARERMTSRGVRIDESVPGHGLGLAIVRDIADSYGARLEFGASPDLGGLRVTVAFPERTG